MDSKSIELNQIHQKIKNRILHLLSYRSRSSKELENHLIKRGFSKENINPVLEELKTKGYIDDKAFTEVYASYLIQTKLLGKNAVYHHFKKHQIDRDFLDKIINDGYRKHPPRVSILKIMQKKFPDSDFSKKNEKRIINYFKRKGFSWEEISSAIHDV